MFLLKSANVSSLLSHIRTQGNTLRDPVPRPAQELNKSVVQIMELLVGKNVTYFGDHYLDLCFLLHLPLVQPGWCHMSPLHTSKTTC